MPRTVAKVAPDAELDSLGDAIGRGIRQGGKIGRTICHMHAVKQAVPQKVLEFGPENGNT